MGCPKFIDFLLLAILSSAICSVTCAQAPFQDLPLQVATDIGLLINFSVPCDLNSAIAVPDQGGLLTTGQQKVVLGIGSQEYRFNGSGWVIVNEEAILLNKTLQKVGRLYSNSTAGPGGVTFEIQSIIDSSGVAYVTTVTAFPVVSVRQAFAIPLQLLNVSSSSSAGGYTLTDYVQRFGTIAGLPPSADMPAKAGDTFTSRFAAFYAFYLPFDISPQLATRVPRCGDERFYGLQYGRDFP